MLLKIVWIVVLISIINDWIVLNWKHSGKFPCLDDRLDGGVLFAPSINSSISDGLNDGNGLVQNNSITTVKKLYKNGSRTVVIASVVINQLFITTVLKLLFFYQITIIFFKKIHL